MRAVVETAAQSLRTCPCVAVEGKTGCFRCVKSYRSQFGPGEPDRDTALLLKRRKPAKLARIGKLQGHYAWRLSRLWWLLRYGRPGGSDTRHGLTTATGGRHGQG